MLRCHQLPRPWTCLYGQYDRQYCLLGLEIEQGALLAVLRSAVASEDFVWEAYGGAFLVERDQESATWTSQATVARASAGIVLVKNDPRDVARIIELSKASYRKMVQNLAWAVGYNVLALPLAAGVLAPLNIVLPPAIGALLMSLSTVVVALNAQTLRGLQLRKEGGR